MKGSEKQVKWANDIKECALRQIVLMRSTYNRMKKDGGGTFAEDTLEYDLAALDVVEKEIIDTFDFVNDASAIIDKRRLFDRANLDKLARLEYKTHAVSAEQKKIREGYYGNIKRN